MRASVSNALAAPAGGGAEGTAATELWSKLCQPALVAEPSASDGMRSRWHERVAVLRWLGMPLVLHAPPSLLLEQLLAPCIAPMLTLIAVRTQRGSKPTSD